jgi:hypothetical protein
MDEYYQVELRGRSEYNRSSSFNHHLENLVQPKINRRCGRYLVKLRNGKYKIDYYFNIFIKK